MWKRRQVSFAYRWNVYSLEPMDQPPRPEFMALLSKMCPRKMNPLSGVSINLLLSLFFLMLFNSLHFEFTLFYFGLLNNYQFLFNVL